jgi:hypothetical protein
MTKLSMRFKLQFPLPEVPALAARYDFLDDTDVIRIGEEAGLRGYFTRPEFLYVCEWKTQRSNSRVEQNSENEIVEATHVALTAKSEVLRIWSPMALYGVSWATSSVLLHLAHADPYPILDFRALESLGIRHSVIPTARFWNDYVDEFRQLLARSGRGKRMLDRALWQWSKDQSNDS